MFGLNFVCYPSKYKTIYKPKSLIMKTFLFVLFAIAFIGFIISIALLFKLLKDKKHTERHYSIHS